MHFVPPLVRVRQVTLANSDLTGPGRKVNGSCPVVHIRSPYLPPGLVRAPWPCGAVVRRVGSRAELSAEPTPEEGRPCMAAVAQETHETLAGLSAGEIEAL